MDRDRELFAYMDAKFEGFKSHIDSKFEGIDHRLDETQGQIQENRALIRENRSLIQENRSLIQENSSLIQENSSLIQENSSLIQENSSLIRDTREQVRENRGEIQENRNRNRHTRVLVEDLCSKMELLAEGHEAQDEKIDRRFDQAEAGRLEDRNHLEAMIQGVVVNLGRRDDGLEVRVARLEAAAG